MDCLQQMDRLQEHRMEQMQLVLELQMDLVALEEQH